MKLIKKKEKNEKIEKSKEIIKKEKIKIKQEKLKQREEKLNKSKLYKILKKFFKIDRDEKISLKEQIFSMIYFEVIGAILCLLILFAITGGQNYFKIYKDLNKLINVYDTIESNYYGELDKEELINSAIDSMLSSIGDSYTTYTEDVDKSQFLEELEGIYEGIGCTVSMTENGEIIVVDVFKNGPAESSGLQTNDIIKQIDDQDFTTKTSEDMANYVKGTKKSKIKLTIEREEVETDIIISRKKVEIPSVTTNIIEQENKKIGYIDVSVFSAVTYKQFKKHLEELEEQNIEGLIIDVREDTGGYLNSVTDISNLFLKKGSIIYQLKDNKTEEKVKDTTKEHREYPIAVLINNSSASASEILASAIKESYGGIIIGTNSYGKGTVQRTKTLSDGSMIKYTTQKWLTPNGNWVNKKGVKPTIEVEFDYENNVDTQLDTAVSEIIKKIN